MTYILPSIVLAVQQVGLTDIFPPRGLQGEIWLIIFNFSLHYMHCYTLVQFYTQLCVNNM